MRRVSTHACKHVFILRLCMLTSTCLTPCLTPCMLAELRQNGWQLRLEVLTCAASAWVPACYGCRAGQVARRTIDQNAPSWPCGNLLAT